MLTFVNHESFQKLGARHALNKLVEVATLQWESEETLPESLDTQQWETSASWWASNQRSRATSTTATTTSTTSTATTASTTATTTSTMATTASTTATLSTAATTLLVCYYIIQLLVV